MRKKKIIKQNETLLERLTAANEEIFRLNSRIKELTLKLKENEKAKELTEERQAENFLKTGTVNKEEKAIPNDYEYASSIIGKIVVEAAKTCNTLAASQKPQKKELINLVLGKTEVTKAVIFEIISADKEITEKKQLIDSEYNSVNEYFKNILEQ
ncbi:MAG: hypothetical protein II802_04315 [Clostridia bacterium]|nr:hypothetical protein [Clostridia bacterium]